MTHRSHLTLRYPGAGPITAASSQKRGASSTTKARSSASWNILNAKTGWHALLKPNRRRLGVSSADPVTHNPHSNENRPRFPPCQVCRRWMASILQPQTLDNPDYCCNCTSVRIEKSLVVQPVWRTGLVVFRQRFYSPKPTGYRGVFGLYNIEP